MCMQLRVDIEGEHLEVAS